MLSVSVAAFRETHVSGTATPGSSSWAEQLDEKAQQKIRQDPSAGQHVGFNGIDIQAVTCQFCLATFRGEDCSFAGLG